MPLFWNQETPAPAYASQRFAVTCWLATKPVSVKGPVPSTIFVPYVFGFAAAVAALKTFANCWR